MARNVNQQQMVANFQSGMSSGGQKYKQGVMGVTENPASAAAAKVADGTWAANTAAAAGRLQAKLSQVTLQGWQAAASTYGASAYSASAQKAAANYAKIAPQLAQAAQQASQAAAGVTGPLAKVQAAMNAMKSAFGKNTI